MFSNNQGLIGKVYPLRGNNQKRREAHFIAEELAAKAQNKQNKHRQNSVGEAVWKITKGNQVYLICLRKNQSDFEANTNPGSLGVTNYLINKGFWKTSSNYWGLVSG